MTHETQSAGDAEGATYVFSARELARLNVYRAAVIAGFYNEQTELTTRAVLAPPKREPHLTIYRR